MEKSKNKQDPVSLITGPDFRKDQKPVFVLDFINFEVSSKQILSVSNFKLTQNKFYL